MTAADSGVRIPRIQAGAEAGSIPFQDGALGGRNLFGNLLGGLFGVSAAAAIQPQAAAAATAAAGVSSGGGLSGSVLSNPVLSAAAPAILAGPSGGTSAAGGVPTAAGGAPGMLLGINDFLVSSPAAATKSNPGEAEVHFSLGREREMCDNSRNDKQKPYIGRGC